MDVAPVIVVPECERTHRFTARLGDDYREAERLESRSNRGVSTTEVTRCEWA